MASSEDTSGLTMSLCVALGLVITFDSELESLIEKQILSPSLGRLQPSNPDFVAQTPVCLHIDPAILTRDANKAQLDAYRMHQQAVGNRINYVRDAPSFFCDPTKSIIKKTKIPNSSKCEIS